jgi:hypothetical protein
LLKTGDFDSEILMGAAALRGWDAAGGAVDANAFRGVLLHGFFALAGFFAWLEDGCG